MEPDRYCLFPAVYSRPGGELILRELILRGLILVGLILDSGFPAKSHRETLRKSLNLKKRETLWADGSTVLAWSLHGLSGMHLAIYSR